MKTSNTFLTGANKTNQQYQVKVTLLKIGS